MLLAACPAHAEWRVTPILLISEIWTDNVNLTEDQFAHSDLITQVSPGITVANRSRRLTVDATAQLHGFAYLHDSDKRNLSEPGMIGAADNTSNTQRTYSGNLKGEVLSDLFFVEATASRSTGLLVKPKAPIDRPSPFWSSAEMTWTGMWRVSGVRLSRSSRARPPTPCARCSAP